MARDEVDETPACLNAESAKRDSWSDVQEAATTTHGSLQTLTGAGLKWQIEAELVTFVQQSIMPHLDRLASFPKATVVKENRLRTVIRLPYHAGELYVKLFQHDRWSDYAKSLIIPTKAMTEWRNTRRCYEQGVATARPAFVAESRRLGVATACLVATPGRAMRHDVMIDQPALRH